MFLQNSTSEQSTEDMYSQEESQDSQDSQDETDHDELDRTITKPHNSSVGFN